MTGTELLTHALALMDEDTTTTEYNISSVSFINSLLAECFDINNSIRLSKSEAVLTSIPSISALSETLTYEDALVKAAFPYGLAGNLLGIDPSQAILANNYRNKYEEQKEYAKRANYVDITDSYAGDAE